jgi:hypothetical protein
MPEAEADPADPAVQAIASQIIDIIIALDDRCEQLERRLTLAMIIGAVSLAALAALTAGAIAIIGT